MEAGGNVNINGLVIDTDGNATTAKGVSLDDHTHTGNMGIPTSPPIVS